MNKNILLTGSTGFIGKELVKSIIDSGLSLSVALRAEKASAEISSFVVGGLDHLTDWSVALVNQDVVIHCAARVHIMNDSSSDPLSEFRVVNTEGAINLARQAAEAGVKRFIFLSSISVNGMSNTTPFFVNDLPAPVEDSAISKLEAEVGLRKIAAKTGMEVVVIRPPLVYGFGAPGNFGKLVKLVSKNLPLPFGAIQNKRSLVALDNLIDLIITCIDHPNAGNQTFLVSDDYDVSTTELLSTMALAAGKKPRLLYVPANWLNLVAKLTGKEVVIERLCGSLQVDMSHTKDVLGWKPPVSFREGIHKCFKKG